MGEHADQHPNSKRHGGADEDVPSPRDRRAEADAQDGGEPRDYSADGGGLAGLSAAIYLSRAKRDVLVIDSGKSMARWEPEVQNYLGFPESISGERLVDYGWKQACASA